MSRLGPANVSTFPLGRWILHGSDDAARCLQSGVLVVFRVGESVNVAPDAAVPLAAHLDGPRCGKLVGVERNQCMLAGVAA